MFGFIKKLFGTKPTVNPCPEAPYKIETPASKLDVNKDGKVNLEDAKEVAKKTKARAKKAVSDVKQEVKKKAGRKPKSK